MSKLTVPIYAPPWNTMAAEDWGIETIPFLTPIMQAPFRIITVPVLCTEPFEFSYNPEAEHLPWSEFDLVILTDIEFRSTKQIDAWAKKIGIRRYVLAIGGKYPDEVMDPDTMVWRPWWGFNLMNSNQYQDTQADNKPYKFCALLGARRPHRDYVMFGMQRSGLLDQSIVTYRDVFHGSVVSQLSEKVADIFFEKHLLFPYVSPNLDPTWEVSNQIDNTISPFVPWDIYRRTDYDIVCETLATSTEFFMSEKTTKVFLGKRVFVMFGNYQFLRHLRAHGFQTFESVMDESYDDVKDNIERYAAAWDQVEWLAKQDATEIYDKLAPVLEHNHRRLFELHAETNKHMRRILANNIPAQYWS